MLTIFRHLTKRSLLKLELPNGNTGLYNREEKANGGGRMAVKNLTKNLK